MAKGYYLRLLSWLTTSFKSLYQGQPISTVGVCPMCLSLDKKYVQHKAKATTQGYPNNCPGCGSEGHDREFENLFNFLQHYTVSDIILLEEHWAHIKKETRNNYWHDQVKRYAVIKDIMLAFKEANGKDIIILGVFETKRQDTYSQHN